MMFLADVKICLTKKKKRKTKPPKLPRKGKSERSQKVTVCVNRRRIKRKWNLSKNLPKRKKECWRKKNN